MALLRVVLLLLALTHNQANARAVNLSSVWLLPEEGYPVFYRYFRDRITWYEADAVCQFHHGELITIDSSSQFDAARAYLKEMDVANFVWTGLKRASSKQNFLWPDSKAMENPEGHWAVEVPKMDEPLCAAVDPSSDYRWQPLPCSGPTVAAFVCQMEVPTWAMKEDGCMLTSLPSLTVTFLPEQGAVELSSDCGLDGTRRIACKGKANREQMIRQLSCESSSSSTEAATMSSNDPWEDQQSTRYRRSEVTSDMSTQVNATQDILSIDHDASTASTPVKVVISEENVNQLPEVAPGLESMKTPTSPPPSPAQLLTTLHPSSTISTTQLLTTREISVTKNIQQINELENSIKPTNISTSVTSYVTKATTIIGGQLELAIGLMGLASGPPPIEKRQSSKPIPPSLKGNSPFIDPSSIAENASTPKIVGKSASVNVTIVTTEEAESQGGPPDSHEILGGNDGSDSLGSSSSGRQPSTAPATNPSIQQYKKNVQDSGEDHSEETVSSSFAPDTALTTMASTTRSTMGQDAMEEVDDGDEPLPTPDSLSDEQLPGRPNRNRLLVHLHPQHRSFYAYFLNRVLG